MKNMMKRIGLEVAIISQHKTDLFVKHTIFTRTPIAERLGTRKEEAYG
jgi:hypothetical protein